MLKNKYILSLTLLISIPVCTMERPPRLDAKPAAASKVVLKPTAKPAAAAPVVAAMPKLVLKASAKPAAAVANTKSTCAICFDEKTALDTRTLACGHKFCVDCLRGNIQTAIRDKQTQALRCLDPSCKRPIEINDLRKIVYDKDTQNQINDIQLQEWMTQQANIKHCPTPNCHFSFVNERADQFTHKCPDCKREYCGKCLFAHNPQTSCTQAEQDRNLANDKDAQARANARWLADNTRQCPRCHATIEKNGGCNHMTCQKCHYEFCWVCLNDYNLRGHGPFGCSFTPANPLAPRAAQQQEEQITLENAHLFFARDPRGFINLMRSRHDLQIGIDMSFAERFMNLSCEDQGRWTARIERLAAENGHNYRYMNILNHWNTELEHLEPFTLRILTYHATREGTFMAQVGANQEENMPSQQLVARITQWIIEQNPRELIMFHNINADLGILVCETSLSQERLQEVLNAASRHFRNQIPNQPAQPVAPQRVLEVRDGYIRSLPNVPVALFDQYANYIRDFAIQTYGYGNVTVRAMPGRFIGVWLNDGRRLTDATLQRLVDEAHNHFANQNR